MSDDFPLKRVTVPQVALRKGSAQKIVCLTAYDYFLARLIDQAGVDLILVGDSLATVVQGQPTTLPVTLEEMIYHCSCVTRAVERALVVGDLPFLSYQVSPEQACQSAGLLLKQGGVAAVKLEGGVNMFDAIWKVASIDIPVVGHIGLTPQSYHRMGGHRIQGKTSALKNGKAAKGSRTQILEDAMAVEEAGAFCVVLEGIPAELAAEITEKLIIPTIGIGAGPDCDGQILVTHDLLGFSDGLKPKFVKQYCNMAAVVKEAVADYCSEVRSGEYPTPQYSYSDILKAVGQE